jgi:NarL family two-component system response regulator LiaR
MNSPIRVLIADDHPIFRKGLRALLTTEDDIQVVGEARDGVEAVAAAAALRPDVILMDMMMPQLNGVETTRQILAQQACVRVLVLTAFGTDDLILSAIKAGARGYLLKDSRPEDLIEAIRQVARGEASLEPCIASRILTELSHDGSGTPRTDPLSAREVEVLRLVAQGKTNREIAQQLVITEMTVRSHVSNILTKLHLASRVQATLYALREGIASLQEEEVIQERQGV